MSRAGAQSWSCGGPGPRGTGTCWGRSDAAAGRAPPSRRTSGPRGVSCRTDHSLSFGDTGRTCCNEETNSYFVRHLFSREGRVSEIITASLTAPHHHYLLQIIVSMMTELCPLTSPPSPASGRARCMCRSCPRSSGRGLPGAGAAADTRSGPGQASRPRSPGCLEAPELVSRSVTGLRNLKPEKKFSF